jgi:PAS domain S-box-containing protein
MNMSDERLEQLAKFAECLAEGRGVEPLDMAGDDLIARIAAGLDGIARRLPGGPADKALFSRGPVVVFRWRNEEGWPVEFVSANVADLTGYPAEEFASGRLPYASLIMAEDLERVGQEVAENSESAEWFEHEPYRIRREDGEILWIYDYTVVLRDEQGAATHFYGYIMDITDRVASDTLIREQLELINNLGAPIVHVWEGVLAIPLIGLLNEVRAARVTEALLDRVAASKTRSVILDFTGVEVIDTSTVLHLGRMVRAVGLLGCECVFSGMSPGVAQAIVSLDVDFGSLRIFRTLAAALPAVI